MLNNSKMVKSDAETFQSSLWQLNEYQSVRRKHPVTSVSHTSIGDFRFSAPQSISVQAQDFLLALLFLARQQGYDTTAVQENQIQMTGNAEFQNEVRYVRVKTSSYELARILGYKNPGQIKKLFNAALREMASIEVEFSYVVPIDAKTSRRFFCSSNFLSYSLIDDFVTATGAVTSDTYDISLNWFTSAALLGFRTRFSLISLSERGRLSEPAKILHAKLSSQISPGEMWTYGVAGLAAAVWVPSENPNTIRLHRFKIRKCLGELAAAGWKIEYEGKKESCAKITRPKVQK